MDYKTYKEKFFVKPQPEPRFDYLGLNGVALFFEDYQAALDYYSAVLGPPAYIEGEYTHGWRLGNSWLTLFPSKSGGDPRNVELTINMPTPDEADRLQRAFIEAGGTGEPPSDQLMYEPIRYCAVTDPFGTEIIIISLISGT
jgi:uncharacterized glyoxalase superfamily protein PhnB